MAKTRVVNADWELTIFLLIGVVFGALIMSAVILNTFDFVKTTWTIEYIKPSSERYISADSASTMYSCGTNYICSIPPEGQLGSTIKGYVSGHAYQSLEGWVACETIKNKKKTDTNCEAFPSYLDAQKYVESEGGTKILRP